MIFLTQMSVYTKAYIRAVRLILVRVLLLLADGLGTDEIFVRHG